MTKGQNRGKSSYANFLHVDGFSGVSQPNGADLELMKGGLMPDPQDREVPSDRAVTRICAELAIDEVARHPGVITGPIGTI